MSTLLQVNHLKKVFAPSGAVLDKTKETVYAVNDVSFSINKCETVGVVGESGCGKTTLGRSILRLTEPTDGEIIFDGVDVRNLNKKELQAFRSKMQIIFQDPLASLDPRWTIGKTLRECVQIYDPKISKYDAEKEVDRLLQIVGLPEYSRNKYPHELSGGQRQRIGIAKAIALKPQFIVADEPVSALDVSVQAQILNLMQDLKKEFQLSYMFISHDLSVVKFISDKICVMYLGRIVEMADTDEFFGAPLHPYSYELLKSVPEADPSKRGFERREQKENELQRSQEGCAFRNRCPLCSEICEREIPQLREIRPGHLAACHLPEDILAAQRI